MNERPYTPLEAEAAAGVNMEKFIASVEKYKQLENDKQENKHEYDKLINQKKDNLDAIITGIPSEEFQQQQQQQQQEELQDANQGTVINDQEEVMMID